MKPNKVERTSRQVIEHKLLTALEDGRTVAILASEQDLKDMIAALYGYELAETKGNLLTWREHINRRKNLAAGLTQLLQEAFPGNSPIPEAACPPQ